MVRSLNKRQKKLFYANKGFYIGFSLLIILSVALLLGYSTASISLKKSVDNDREINKLEDAWFDYEIAMTEEEIQTYEREFNLLLQKSQYKDIELENGKGSVLRLRPPYEKINIHSVVDGRDLEQDSDILIDRFFFEANDYEFGKQIIIGEKEFFISGTLSTPDYLQVLKNNMDLVPNSELFGIAVLSKEDFLGINGDISYNYAVKFSEDNSAEFRERLGLNGEVFNFTEVENNARIKPFDGEIVALIKIAKIAPITIVLICMLIMSVVISRQLRKEYVYIGTLKALGYKTKEIATHYLILPFIVVVLSSIVGIIVGIFLAKPLLFLTKAEYSLPKIDIVFSFGNMLLSFVIPVVLTLSGAFYSVIKAMRIDTVLLLKACSQKNRNSFLLKISPKKFGSFKFRYKIKEAMRNIPRSALMVFGIMVAAVFMLSGFIVNNSMGYLMDNSFDKVFLFEYQYILNMPLVDDIEIGEKQTIKELVYSNGDISYSVILKGIEENSEYIRLRDKNGDDVNVDKTIFSYSVVHRLKLKKGDEVTLTDSNNLKTYTLFVDEIADINVGNFIYLPRTELNSMLEYPPDAFNGIIANKEIEDIDEIFIYNIHSLSATKQCVEKSVCLFEKLLYFLTVIAGIIGVVVVYIVANMLVSENSKTISMLMVMGYHSKEINSILLNSSTPLVFAGFVLALPVALAVMKGFLDAITVNMFFVFFTKISVIQTAICFGFFLIIYFLSLQTVKRKTGKINLSECIKAVE